MFYQKNLNSEKNMAKRRKYKQGIFHPINTLKYHGSTPIIFRSSLELKFMRWLDINNKIIKWGSESAVIPYRSVDEKIHRYFVDFNCELEVTKGVIKKYLVEIKPDKQTRPPEEKKRRNKNSLLFEKLEYLKNIAKWNAAKKWCAIKGYEFIIITEKQLS